MRVFLRKTNIGKNMDRYYSVETTPNLFGHYVVERHCGRRGTSGQSKTDWFDDLDQALQATECIANKKRKRGYTLGI